MKIKSSIVTSIAIICFIIAGFSFVFSEYLFQEDEMGVYIAILASIFPTWHFVKKSNKNPNIKKKNKQNQKKTIRFRVIISINWLIFTLLYLYISALTEAWSETWVLFVLAFLMHNIISLLFKKCDKVSG